MPRSSRPARAARSRVPGALVRVVEEAPSAMVLLDRTLRVLASSARWRHDFAVSPAIAQVGCSLYEAIPDVPRRWKSAHRRCLEGAVERKAHDLFVRADGSRRRITWQATPWRHDSGTVGGIVLFSEDVTHEREAAGAASGSVDAGERRRADDALYDSERRLRMALEASTAGIWTWDIATDVVSWDERSRQILGLGDRAYAPMLEWIELLHEDDRQMLLDTRRHVLASAGGDDAWNVEFRVPRPDGRIVWVTSFGGVERDASARVVRMTGINLDITPRKLAESALLESRDRERETMETTRLLLETASQGIISVDCDGRIRSVNAAAEQMFGWSRTELVGRLIETLVPDGFRERHVPRRRDYFTTPNPRPMSCGDLLALRKGGSLLPVEVSLTYVPTAQGGFSVAFVTDISTRKQAEEALRQSHAELESHARQLHQKAEQLRRLASDLTRTEQHVREQLARKLHDDLQQILFSVKLKVDRVLANDGVPADPTLLGRAVAEIEQAIAATRSLSVELFPPVLYDGELSDALSWLAYWIEQKYNVHVDLLLEPGADPGSKELRTLLFESVRELLFNVVKHAQVGRASLALSNGPGEQVRIAVSDGGAGFDPASVFHRPPHRVSMGLFSIRERVTLLGGHFDADSAPGHGSRFTLDVPRQVMGHLYAGRVARPEQVDHAEQPDHAVPPEAASASDAGLATGTEQMRAEQL